MQAVIDGGAMKNTMCSMTWQAHGHRLTELSPSRVTFSVADNHRIPSQGKWTGTIDVASMETTQTLEVFDSNGAFQVILGKPWLQHVHAVHKFETDEITIQVGGHTKTIRNNADLGETTGPKHNQQQRGDADDSERSGMARHKDNWTARRDTETDGRGGER